MREILKRTIDVAGALAGLALALPLLSAAAVAVEVTMARPVIFRQLRAGRQGHPFNLYKLRTMSDARDTCGNLLADEERQTPAGRWIRGHSIDELPQLWNVLRGDMSLVGPRPLLPEYVARYSQFERRRLEVKPGITGWAQVNGRNSLSWDRKFELDVWYVDHRCYWLDVKILATTAWQVLRGHGINQPGHATMPEFLGSQAAGSPERIA